jgi:tetratricopeptide (TPR) repeat protein
MPVTIDKNPAHVADRAPRNGKVLHREGVAAYERQEYDLAVALLQDAARTPEASQWTWLWLSRALLKNGAFAEATTAVEQALARSPGWSKAILHQVDIALSEGRRGRCLALLEGFILDNARDPKLLREALKRLVLLPAYPEALATANLLLVSEPEDAEALQTRAVALWKIGEYDGAVEGIAEAAGALPKDWVPSARARYEFARKGAVAASRAVDAAREPFDDADLLAELAEALWSEGHVIRSLSVYDRLLALRPNDDELRARRERAVGTAMFLLDGWDHVCADAIAPVSPVARRILWLTAGAFPYTRSPTDIDRHARARRLLSAGWRPTVVTLLPQPWNLDVADVALSEEIDGVEYLRLLPLGPIDGSAGEVLRENGRALSDAVPLIRPAVIHAENDVMAAVVGTALGRALNCPVVWEVGSLPHVAWLGADASRSPSRQYYRLWRQTIQQCLGDANLVVAGSPAVYQQVIDHGASPSAVRCFADDGGAATAAGHEPWLALYRELTASPVRGTESALPAVAGITA